MSISLRHKHKLQEPDRRDYVNTVLSAFRSFRSITPVGYLSAPISSGERFYRILKKYKVNTREELLEINQDLMLNEVIRPNAKEAIALGDQLAKEWGLPIIVPTVFESQSQRWSQNDYMHVWFQVIREMVGQTIMSDGWQYSNGGVQEFVHSIQLQFRLMPNYSSDGRFPRYLPFDLYPEQFANLGIEFPRMPLIITSQWGQAISLDIGALLIAKAVVDLCSRGFVARTLLAALMQLIGMATDVEREYSHYLDYRSKFYPPYCSNSADLVTYWDQIIAFCSENEREIYEICCHH